MDPAILALPAGLALLLVSAKAHGRQLRLERELEGHHEVVFGGRNHPWVEALWRRDRVRFWMIVPLVALAQAGLLFLARARGLDYLSLLIAPTVVGFVSLGLVSMLRLRGALRARPDADAAWARQAWRGSATWWLGVGALLAASVGLWAAGRV